MFSIDFWRRVACHAVSTVLPLVAILQAHSQPTPLFRRTINEADRVPLRGNIQPALRAANDLGQVDDDQPTGTLLIVLGRSEKQQVELDEFTKAASTPGSSVYGHWLTPRDFGSRFGLGSADLEKVTSWLENNGLKIEGVSAAANVIRVSGTVGALRAALQTEIHRYQVGSEVHLANATEPSIPAALSRAVRGVVSLNDFRPKAQIVKVPHATHTAQSPGSNRPSPQLTVFGPSPWGYPVAGAPNYDVYFLPAAGDAAIIYDTPNSAMNSAYHGTTWTGSGVTIGIPADSNLSAAAMADIARYRSLFLNETLA